MYSGGCDPCVADYWNVILHLAQWEHPAVSYCVGVAKRLCDAKRSAQQAKRGANKRHEAIAAARARDARIEAMMGPPSKK